MKVLASFRSRWFVVSISVLMVVSLLLTACAPDATGFIITPRLSEQIAARDAGEVVTAIVEVKRKLAELTTEQIYVGLPPEIESGIATVDATNGPAIASKYGCQGCHLLDATLPKAAGPLWIDLGNTSANRVDNQSPALYLYKSIVEPGAYIVPDYVDGVMPKTFKEQMSSQEIATMIAFLLQQTQE